MCNQYCLLCASDEGVFLDIAPDNQSFGDQFEVCLSTKVNETIELSNKICYKCAYELDQCTKFIQKYKKSHETSDVSKTKTLTSNCCLCFESGDKTGHIFDITKDNRSIFSPLQKIRKIFNENLIKDSDSKLICLTCRYNLDVLYDLQKLYQETIINLKSLVNKEVDYANFPKVYTDVVKRKTTTSTLSDITFYGSISSDSDSSEDMAHGKSHVKNRKMVRSDKNAKSKVRICDECCNIVANGKDMYRFHRTGLTVCKSCWITMDPSKGKAKRRPQNRSTEMKLCSVFLKDVLNEKTEEVLKVEQDKDGNKLYIISDESSQDEDKTQSTSPKMKQAINGSMKQERKRKSEKIRSAQSTPSKRRILSSERGRPNTRAMKLRKALSDVEQSSSNRMKSLKRKRKSTDNDHSSDSDFYSREVQSDKSSNRRRLGISSVSDMEDISSKSKKKMRSTLEEITTNIHSEPSDESSNEGSINFRRNTRSVSNTLSPGTSKIGNKDKKEVSRARSTSLSSKEMTPPMEFKSPKSMTVSETKTEYTCDKCNKKFDTKLSGARHKLTHLKQAKLELERINILSDEDKQEINTDSQEDKISKKAKPLSKRTASIDKHAEDPSEEIAINVDDDTDDEEIFSISKKEKSEETQKEEKCDENKSKNEDTTDKPDAVENEHIEKELTKIQNDKTMTEESQQREETIEVVSDETLIQAEVEQEQNTNDKDAEILTDKVNTSKDEDNQKIITDAVEECEDLDVEKDKTRENTEIFSTEMEKLTECNSDKQNLDAEICDNEMIESSISSIAEDNKINTTKSDKDHGESCKNNLENTCGVNINEITKDKEIKQCETMDNSQINESKDPEKKEEILSDTKDLDDTTAEVNEDKVEDPEKQQNKVDKCNTETKAVINVDKSNSIEDKIEDNIRIELLNNKKLDDNTDDMEISMDNDDNADSVESILTEDIKIIKNSTEKKESMEKIVDLEKLIENDTDKTYEMQENSSHDSLHDNSTNMANEIMTEVFDIAAAEVQKREKNNSTKDLNDDIEMETLENITREIRNSADMPSLDPITVMEIDDDNDITLN